LYLVILWRYTASEDERSLLAKVFPFGKG
jgi:hypothetical protein